MLSEEPYRKRASECAAGPYLLMLLGPTIKTWMSFNAGWTPTDLVPSPNKHGVVRSAGLGFRDIYKSLLELEFTEFTGVLKIHSNGRMTSAVVLHRGLVVGCIYDGGWKPVQRDIETPLRLAMTDLASEDFLLDYYDLEESLLLASVKLLTGYSVPRMDSMNSGDFLEGTRSFLSGRGLTACIWLSFVDFTRPSLLLFYKGNMEGLYDVELKKYYSALAVSEIADQYQMSIIQPFLPHPKCEPCEDSIGLKLSSYL